MFQRIIKQLFPSDDAEVQVNSLLSASTECSDSVLNSSVGAEFRNLLVCLDRSQHAKNTLPYIIALAKGWNAHITLLNVFETNKNHNMEKPADLFDWKIRHNEAQDYLRKVAEESRSELKDIDYELQEGQVIEQICSWGVEHPTDLTVFSSHSDKVVTTSSLGSTAVKILQEVSGSLLLIPATAHRIDANTTVPYSRILLPLDGSVQAETAFPIALRLAEIHKAELVLAHIITTPQLVNTGPRCSNDTELVQRLFRRNEVTAKAYLDACLAKIDTHKVSARARLIKTGDARDVLLQIAREEKTDLVVLSAHGISGRVNEPCGSVTAHLFSHLAIPLLIVRECARQNRDVQEAHQDETRIPLRASA
ncbi:universal stress protein [Leucothrix arctica]|uniref:UspA domain-containing protein n=1 Tax=Leucothrix arctica TaxID=1481894 RepID=A0A317CBQ6_9GAMM|nr:universal stress protein [Leucothrix arctica]PWQ93790.1 hypothetical protein DKT75_19495 [Leucothrix arctica]